MWLPWPDLRELTLFLALSLRLGAALAVIPFFRGPGLSPVWRGLFTLVLALALTPLARQAVAARGIVLPLPAPQAWPDLVILAVKELVIGFVTGFLVFLAFSAVELTGVLVDLPLGFGMDALLDPLTGAASPLFGRLFSLLALVLFGLAGGLEALLLFFGSMLTALPPGTGPQLEPAVEPITRFFSELFVVGFRTALPLVAALLVTDLALGLLSRAVPQLNLFTVGFPVKEIGSLVLLLLLVPFIVKALAGLFEPGGLLWAWVDRLLDLLSGTQAGAVDLGLSGPGLLGIRLNLQLFAGEKTETPTPRRREESRRQGQVAHTPELGLGLALIAVAFFFRLFGPAMGGPALRLAGENWQQALTQAAGEGLTPHGVILAFLPFLRDGLLLMTPIVLPALLVAVVAQGVQTGFLVTPRLLVPRWERLNPVAGLSRLFSWQGMASLLKSLLKAGIIGYTAYSVLRTNYDSLPLLAEAGPGAGMGRVAAWIEELFYRVGFATVLVGLADYVFQRSQLEKQLRMTREEVREELKQTEGDPQIKARQRQRQRQIARNRQLREVRRADVVVTNPIHLAVALRYDARRMRAPKVVAKGAGVLARRIREIAGEAGVPVVENPPLARALYRSVRVGREIPVELYRAVAELLAYVYRRYPGRRAGRDDEMEPGQGRGGRW